MIRMKDSNDYYTKNRVDGWFTNFFPYNDKGERRSGIVKNSMNLQKELLEVPFTLNIVDGLTTLSFKMQFLTGFVGLTQNEKTGSLKPEIGWIVQPAK